MDKSQANMHYKQHHQLQCGEAVRESKADVRERWLFFLETVFIKKVVHEGSP